MFQSDQMSLDFLPGALRTLFDSISLGFEHPAHLFIGFMCNGTKIKSFPQGALQFKRELTVFPFMDESYCKCIKDY